MQSGIFVPYTFSYAENCSQERPLQDINFEERADESRKSSVFQSSEFSFGTTSLRDYSDP